MKDHLISKDIFVKSAVAIGADPILAHKAYANIEKGGIFLFAVNGKLAAGKDTIAPAVLEKLGIDNAIHIYYATALKDEVDQAIKIVFNSNSVREAIKCVSLELNVSLEDAAFVVGSLWVLKSSAEEITARTRTPEIRSVLQFWGTEVRRSKEPLYWVNKTLLSAIEAIAEGNSVYATDVRFLNEVEWAQRVGFFVVRLEVTADTQRKRLFDRDGIVADEASLNHPSEVNLDGHLGFDLIIDNNGSIQSAVDQIIEHLKG